MRPVLTDAAHRRPGKGGNRRGIALVAVLAVMALLAILTAGAIASTARLRSGAVLAADDAGMVASAEFAINDAAIQWDTLGLAALGIGTTRVFSVAVPMSPQPVTAQVTATRLSASLFWMVADVPSSSVTGRDRRLSRIFSLPTLAQDSLGVITAAGGVMIGDQVEIAADSQSSSGCTDDGRARVVVPSGSDVVSQSGGSVGRVTVDHRAVPAADYTTVAGLTAATVTKLADVRYPAGASAVLNPGQGILVGDGGLTISGGTGSGVLFVSGALTITGSVSFTGLIVAAGGITIQSGTVSIVGAIESGPAADGGPSARITGTVAILGSICQAQALTQSALPPRAVDGRSWAELY